MDRAWRSASRVEVAWTGPTPPLSNLRRTEQALLDVVDQAKQELWLVSFAAYQVDSVCAALLRAADRGCRVRIVLESTTESGGKLGSGGASAMPEPVRSSCEILTWPKEMRALDDRGRSGLLHAKCAVADGQMLFVGSANLTEHAFELNLELGVLVRNERVAGQVAEQLHWLVSSKHLRPAEA